MSTTALGGSGSGSVTEVTPAAKSADSASHESTLWQSAHVVANPLPACSRS